MLASEISTIIENLSPEDAIAELSSAVADWEADYEKMRAQWVNSTTQCSTLRDILRATEENLNSLRQTATEQHAEIARLKQELSFAQSANRQHVRDLTDAREENSRLRSGGLALAI